MSDRRELLISQTVHISQTVQNLIGQTVHINGA